MLHLFLSGTPGCHTITRTHGHEIYEKRYQGRGHDARWALRCAGDTHVTGFQPLRIGRGRQ